MKIKYINEVENCCKNMKELMTNDDLISYGVKSNNELIFSGYFGVGEDNYIRLSIKYCPFCGEKIVFE